MALFRLKRNQLSWANQAIEQIWSHYAQGHEENSLAAYSLIVLATHARGSVSSDCDCEREGMDGVCLARPWWWRLFIWLTCHGERWLRWHWHRCLKERQYQLRPSRVESLHSLTMMWFSSSTRFFSNQTYKITNFFHALMEMEKEMKCPSTLEHSMDVWERGRAV